MTAVLEPACTFTMALTVLKRKEKAMLISFIVLIATWGLHPVSKIEIAETTKVVENCHRYLQVAFAEELYLYCQANNINFLELRDALNTKWNVKILEPREGI